MFWARGRELNATFNNISVISWRVVECFAYILL
jgi:hypothetical protein